MENLQETLTLRPGIWNERAEFWIELAMQHASTDNVRQQVESQAASLFYVEFGNAVVGAFVLRIDELSQHNEGVIVAGSGCFKGIDLIADIVPAIEKMFINCATIRYHTANPAVARKMQKQGYQIAEIVCKKEIYP